MNCKASSSPIPGTRTCGVSVRVSLSGGWQAAATKATALGWRDYGVLVTRGTGEGYLFIVADDSPEYDYTQSTIHPLPDASLRANVAMTSFLYEIFKT